VYFCKFYNIYFFLHRFGHFNFKQIPSVDAIMLSRFDPDALADFTQGGAIVRDYHLVTFNLTYIEEIHVGITQLSMIIPPWSTGS